MYLPNQRIDLCFNFFVDAFSGGVLVFLGIPSAGYDRQQEVSSFDVSA